MIDENEKKELKEQIISIVKQIIPLLLGFVGAVLGAIVS